MSSPTRVTLYSGYTVLCGAVDGSLGDDTSDGLYDFDARILSRRRLTFGGRQPELVSSAQLNSDHWQAVLRVPRAGGSADGPLLPQDAIEIAIDRVVGPALAETITVHNRSAVACQSVLAFAFDADFVDAGMVGDDEKRPGKVSRRWLPAEQVLEIAFDGAANGRQLQRAVRIRVDDTPDTAQATADGLAFDLALPARGSARLHLVYQSLVDGRWREPKHGRARRDAQRNAWHARHTTLEGMGRASGLAATFERAAEDLFELRNWELEARFAGRADGAAWVLNAGVPSFTGLFGRDTLTAGWQSALLGPRAMNGALAAVAATQAAEDDAWRDAEPGKMIHEARRGPLSELGVIPRDAYYGSQTTPQMFLVALAEAWLWTADEDVLRRYADAARRGVEWSERYGDADGDGFLEYRQRSPKGLRNQGWKDSDEAIRHADGSLAEPPIAAIEEQAFHYIALQRMAAIETVLGDDAAAERYLRRAADLRARFHDAFWMPDERFYALALDRDKRQVRSITSNPGHALATGIVPSEHATEVADRLMSDELFSGWGIRTLAAGHPSYNPLAYHLGAVWPVEQATFALGFKRYGLDDHCDRLVAAMLEAAQACPDHRLPEALSGHPRAEFGRPVFYPDANSPQAWSASATVQLVQVMLGVYPFAPLGALAIVRPRLPEWAEQLTLRKVRVGRATVDLRFDRRRDGSAAHRVIRRRGRLAVAGAGPPQALEPTLFEAVGRSALELAPGRLMRAARILLGIDRTAGNTIA